MKRMENPGFPLDVAKKREGSLGLTEGRGRCPGKYLSRGLKLRCAVLGRVSRSGRGVGRSHGIHIADLVAGRKCKGKGVRHEQERGKSRGSFRRWGTLKGRERHV